MSVLSPAPHGNESFVCPIPTRRSARTSISTCGLGRQWPFPIRVRQLLHFFERVQKQFPAMTRFRRNDGELSLEEERDRDGYRWLSLESKRLSSGHVNPASSSRRWPTHQFVWNRPLPTRHEPARNRLSSTSSSASTSPLRQSRRDHRRDACWPVAAFRADRGARCPAGRLPALLHRLAL